MTVPTLLPYHNNAMSVRAGGSAYTNTTTAATTVVKASSGWLHSITINKLIASATITVYDNPTGTGTVIATITLPGTITALNPFTLNFDIIFNTGLTIVTSGSTDVTVSWS